MNSPPRSVQSSAFAVRCLIFAAIALLFVVLQIHHSLDQGVLAYPITYDDSTYYWEGLNRLYGVYDRGLRALITDFVSRAPHSAWSTATAFAGFAVFGPVDWAPIAANGAVVAAAASALAFATRSLPLSAALAILIAALTWPFTGHLAMQSRPDVVWGLALAGFTAIISPLVLGDISRKRSIAAVLLLALALLSKMTTAPVTIALTLTVAAVVVLLRRSTLSMPWRDSAKPVLWIVFVAFLVSVPIYAVSIVGITSYIYENVFGQNAAVWALQLSPLDHALYHLTGSGGKAMMARWLAIWIVTFIGTASLVVKRRDRSAIRVAIPFAAAFAVGYLAVTLPPHKSPFIGAVVPAFFLVSWVAMTVYVANRLVLAGNRQSGWRAAALWAFPLTGLLLFQWHGTIMFGPNTPQRHHDAATDQQIVQQMLADLEDAGVNRGIAYFVGSAPYLNAETLRYYATRRHRPAPEFRDDIFSSDADLLEKRINDSAAIVSFSEDNSDVSRWLPSGNVAFQKRAAQSLQRAQDDTIVFHYPSPHGGEATMHVRRGSFFGFKPVAGLGGLEGPYPEWNLPFVRWGFGPETRISASEPVAMPGILRIEAQSPFADQVVDIVINGKNVGQLTFTKKDVPETFQVVLGELAVSSTVVLRYSRWTEPSASDPRKMAVLFRRLQLF